MELKPFDLEKALAGEKVITRNGIEVLEIIFFKKRKYYPVLILLPYSFPKSEEFVVQDHNQYMYACDEKGKACWQQELDLFMAPKIKKIWIGYLINYDSTLTIIDISTDNPCYQMNRNSCSIDGYKIKEIDIEI